MHSMMWRLRNGKTTILQHHLLQKQTASSCSTIPTAVETLQYKDGKKTRLLNIECIVGENNKKYIRLSRQIPLPKYAYLLVNAVDTLMSKFPDEEKPPIFHEFLKISRLNCEYKLEIRPNIYGKLKFSMELFKNTKNASSYQFLIFFPVSLLPKFRDRMVKILAKFNGTEQCGPCPSPLPKWIRAHQVRDEEPQPRIYRRESLKYSMDRDKPADWRINIQLERVASGRKFIQISQRYDKPRLNAKSAEEKYIYIDFPNILVPEDGYNLLSGMIDLSNDFKKKEDGLLNQRNQSSLICSQIVKGYRYDYKLEILHSDNDQQQQLEFRMETIINSANLSHRPKKLCVPIEIFEWLQAQMALTLAADLDLGDYENREEIEEDKSLSSNNKLPAGNEKTTNLQHHLLQKQTASSYSTIPTAVETFKYKSGKKTRLLNIECIEGENNEKYISLSVQAHIIKYDFPYIPLCEDAHSLVKAMDTMMSKFPDEEKPPIFREIVKSSIPNHEYELVIFTYKYDQLEFLIELIKNMENPLSNPLGRIFLPVSLLPKLRDRMAKMLTEFDGTKQYGSFPLPLPKWITANQVKDKEPLPRIYRRESLKYSIDPDKPADCWRIKIEFTRGANGKKYIEISQRYDKPRLNAKRTEEEYIYIDFPNILVPEDGYNLLSGMIDLSNDFKKREDGLLNQRNNQSPLICRQIVKGVNYDYKLEIHLRKEQLKFMMETIANRANPSHKPKTLWPMPIDVFDWLQAQMAYSLAADLDTEEYEDKENIQEEKSAIE